MTDDRLYHYTTLGSFCSIMQSNTLWATHLRYMNDTSEQQMLWQLLRNRLDIRLTAEHGPNRAWLGEIRELAISPLQNDVFVISFSQDGGDRLSQWRGYSGGAGVSIGFDIETLQQCCSAFTTTCFESGHEHSGAMLLPVQYIGKSGSAHTNKLIDEMLDNPAQFQGPDPHQRFCQTLSFFGANVKHVAFAEEEEWRIMIFDHTLPQEMKFRVRKSMLTPYRELPFVPAITPAIAKVVVGPSPHQKETRESIRNMTGLPESQVVLSDTPYRDW